MITILRTDGYRTLEAFDGATGLALYFQHRSQIDIVLSDIDMPVPGPEMVERILDHDPAAKVVFTSGSDEWHKLPPRLRRSTFLPKPFTMEQLLRSIDDCSNNSSGARKGTL